MCCLCVFFYFRTVSKIFPRYALFVLSSNMWRILFIGIIFFSHIDLIQATIECAPSIFRRRTLLRKLATSGDDHNSQHDGDHDTEGPQVLYFFCVALVLGAVTSYLLQRWNSKVPYTVVMFAEGMIAAVIYMHFDKGPDFYSFQLTSI